MPGIQGLDYQMISIPFSKGVETKDHPQSSAPDELDIARDVQFDTFGALTTRFPMLAIGTNILGGGTLTNFRRAYECNGELVCLTADALYSWDSRDTAWVLRGTHLAVALSETTRFETSDDQINADRAELGNTVFLAWSNGTSVFAASLDKATGAVLASPTQVAAVGTRPRLVAGTTIVFLFFDSAGNLNVSALRPNAATPSGITGATTSTVVAAATFNSYYDVTISFSQDLCVGASRNLTTTGYAVWTVTWNGSAFGVNAVTKARTCDGPIAVAPSPDGAHVQIVRSSTTNIQGDYLTFPALADVFTAQAIGTSISPVDQITACYRPVQVAAHWRCHAFWHGGESPNNSTGFEIKTNTVDDANTIGTQASFLAWSGVASRAFAYNGFVYVWCAFGQTSGIGGGGAMTGSSGQFQNAYYLLRDDQFLCAKAVYARGGGLNPTIGRLPGVALTDGSTTFRWCAAIRRITILGQGTTGGAQIQNAGYAMRAPQDVTFTFDSNDARRAVRLGQTLYLAGGEILQYDGVGLYEAGFHVYPWFFDAVVTGPGNITPIGTYAYKSTLEWTNALGDLDSSTTATVATALLNIQPDAFAISTLSSPLSHKTIAHGSAPAVRIWRTTVNPLADAPFYLVTSLNPTVVSGNNRYVSNTPGLSFNPTFIDGLADAVASLNATNPENGAVLSALAPPAATMIVASVDRLFLGGISGQPDTIWYSKRRNTGEVAAFNDGLTVDLPPQGGAMTGVAIHPQTQTLIGFRRDAIYQVPGQGYDNTGGGSNYGPAIPLSTDVGAVNPDAIAVAPFGILFKSDKGWYRLDGGMNLSYVGGPVAAFDGDTILACHTVTSRHQIRIVTSARMLVFDYLVNQWAEWTVADGVHATTWAGSYVYLSSANGVAQEALSITNPGYGWDVETSWIPVTQSRQGRANVLWFQVLGEFRSACNVRVRVAKDYESDGAGSWNWYDDVNWTATPTVVGGPLQLRHGPSRKRCQAIKVRLTAYAPDGVSPPTGEAARLTGLVLLAGAEPGPFRLSPAQEK